MTETTEARLCCVVDGSLQRCILKIEEFQQNFPVHLPDGAYTEDDVNELYGEDIWSSMSWLCPEKCEELKDKIKSTERMRRRQ